MAALLSRKDIAAMFDVELRSVVRWKTDHRGFPRPANTELVKGGSFRVLYARSEIEAWGELTGRWDPVAEVPYRGRSRRKCPCCKVAV
jgi:hypothetical protein